MVSAGKTAKKNSTKLIIGGIVGAVILLAVGIYIWMNANKTTTEDPSADTISSATKESKSDKQPAKPTECTVGDATICKMFAAIEPHKSYVIHASATIQGMDTKTTFYIENPQVSRLVTSANGKEIEMIMTSDATYMKMGDAAWTKQALSPEDAEKRKSERGRLEIINSVSGTSKDMSYEPNGKKPCGDMTCFAYTIVDRSEPDMKTELLFDDKDYLPREATVQVKEEAMTLTYEYTQVSITIPSV